MKCRASWNVAATTPVAPWEIASRSSCFRSSISTAFVGCAAGSGGEDAERRRVAGDRGRRRRGQRQPPGRGRRRLPAAGPPEQPALAEPRAEPAGHREVPRRLDALGEHERAGLLGVGADRVHDGGDRRAGQLLREPQVQLDHLGAQQRHERQRRRVGADVVERDPPAEPADPLDGAQQLGRTCGERALGDLDDDAQLARGALGDREQVVERRGVEHLGLDVDEQRQRRQQTRPTAPRKAAMRHASSSSASGRRAGGREQLVGPLERARGPAGERLVADDRAGVEVDDRLEHAAHAVLAQDGVERAASGRQFSTSWPSAGPPRTSRQAERGRSR